MEDTITGELLAKAKKENQDAIRKNNLSPAEKAILNGLDIVYTFIEVDHAKVEAMYEEYKERNRKQRKITAIVEKLAIPVITSLIIIFLTQAIYFWLELVPKLQALQ